MSTPSWIGRKLSDRYEIEELLGQGGMSAVYKANDPNLRRTVAVKLIHSHLSSDATFVSRFEEEAASVAQLRHPNIIQVFDFSSDEETYYMILEFVPGETVEGQLSRLNADNRRMATKEAVKMSASICDALDYAHERGLIHRDIKPANIMINLQGEAILMDFGVAKIIGGKQHTATGAVVGTALYMSPEVIQGEQPDRRVDIYALGVTLYEALTGEPPFMADSAMSTMMMHVNDPVPNLRNINQDVPEELVTVIRKSLAKKKDERYQTAAEFAAALRAVDLSPDTQRSQPDAPSPAKLDDQAGTMIEQPESLEPSPAGTMIEQPESLEPAGATMIEQPAQAPAPATPSQTPSQMPPAPPAAPPASSGGGLKSIISNPLVIGGVLVGLFLVVVVGFFGLRALFASPDEPAEPTATTVVAAEATQIPTEVAVVVEEPSETPPATDIPEPTPTATATDPAGPFVRINSIALDGSSYVVEYETFGYTEVLPGMHVHFFFNSVAPEDAGVGGAGSWFVYGGPRPFRGYTTSVRPGSAAQMCALVANTNHTIILNTGNCVDLP